MTTAKDFCDPVNRAHVAAKAPDGIRDGKIEAMAADERERIRMRNQDRIRHGTDVITRYAHQTRSGGSFRTVGVDVIADVLHALAYRGHDPMAALDIARDHYETEIQA